MARASATRCCWPPDSCEAERSAKSPHLHQVEGALDLLGDLGARHLRTRSP